MKGLKIFIFLCFSLSCNTCLEIDISDSKFDTEKVNFSEIKNSPYYRKFEISPKYGFDIEEITSGKIPIWSSEQTETCRSITVIKLKFSPVILILDVNWSGHFYFKDKKEWKRVDVYKFSRLIDEINTEHKSYSLDIDKHYESPLANVDRYQNYHYFVVDFYSKLKYFIVEVKYKDDFVFDPNKIDSNKNVSEDESYQNENNKYICSFVKLSHNDSYTFIEIKVESNEEQKTFYFWKGKCGWISVPKNEYTEGIQKSIIPNDTSKDSDLNSQYLQSKSQIDSLSSDDEDVPNNDTRNNDKSETNSDNKEEESDDKRSETDSNPKSNEIQEGGEKIPDIKENKPNSIKSGLRDPELSYLKTDLKDLEEDDLINSLERGLKERKIKERIINAGKKLGEIPSKVINRLKGSFVLQGKEAHFLALIITILIIF